MMWINNLSIALDDGEAPRLQMELRRNEYSKETYALLTIEAGMNDMRIYMTGDQGMAMAVLHGIAVQDRTTKQSTKGTEQE